MTNQSKITLVFFQSGLDAALDLELSAARQELGERAARGPSVQDLIKSRMRKRSRNRDSNW